MPKSVIIFGVLHIILGTLGLIYNLTKWTELRNDTDLYAQLGFSMPITVWARIMLVSWPAIALLVVVLGIGLLKRMAWARLGSIVYGYLVLALASVSLLLHAIELQHHPIFAPAALIRGILTGTAYQCVYPVLTLIFMSKSDVKAAFERKH